MPNLYKQFMDLQSPKPLLVGTVAFVINGVATINMPGGGRLQARGPAQAGQRVVERQDHHLVESAHAQLRQLVAQRAHAGRGQFGLAQHLGKVVARVRLERHRATGQAALGGLGPQQPQHGLVATVDTVKIADGQGAGRG